MSSSPVIRECAVSGLFYPSEPVDLKRQVDSLLGAGAAPGSSRRVIGIVSPHAGYMYSGSTAAAGYSQLRGGSYDTVVVVSPSHREIFEGISVYSGDAYRTPLGTIPINSRLRERLVKECRHVTASEAGHREEHAVEVQLPFLQAVLGEFALLPVVIGNQRREYCFELGEALGKILKSENALLVASTDLSHYYPDTVADKLDKVFIEDVRNGNVRQLMDHLEQGKTEACGGGPVAAALVALERLGARTVEIIEHCNSGNVSGDRGSVVGYLSAVAYA